MSKTYKQCQSCGMPLKNKNGEHYGTEKDGSRSTKWCNLCYVDGAFTQPDMTMEEMQELVDRVLKEEMGSGKVFRWLAVKQIPRLERWKSPK